MDCCNSNSDNKNYSSSSNINNLCTPRTTGQRHREVRLMYHHSLLAKRVSSTNTSLACHL
eukprot:scaffold298649_cov29-Prasinocladus_malaysianus.AAC.1